MATGWWSYSRYARRQYQVREAYMREVAKIFASRMALYPETFVGVAGDGETELSNSRIAEVGGVAGPGLADYSPFAIAEFRDWIRGAGLYAAGQLYAGEGYINAARYAADTTPNDTNGDGISFNSDFGTSFDTWALKHFDWSLTDSTTSDPNAIPAAVYGAPGFSASPAGNPAGFDAPRTRDTSPWWTLWARFRETMVWHHNRDLARWMTTTTTSTGASIPVTHWFAYQIPTDYMFGHTPESPDDRYITSGSPWWTANVQPYGGLGFTSFGTAQSNGAVARTTPGLLNAIRECVPGATGPTCIETAGGLGVLPWGIFEWNPVVAGVSDPQVYLDEIQRLRKYRPRILAPYAWNRERYLVLDSGFETALRHFTTLLADGWAPSLTINKASVGLAATRSGPTILSQSVAQVVTVGQPTGGTVNWTASADQAWVEVLNGAGHGDGTFSVRLVPSAMSSMTSGTYTSAVTVAAPGSVQGTRTVTVTLTLIEAAQAAPPFGAVDTPLQNATGLSGAIAVTGWALDDVSVARVEIWRGCHEGIDRPRLACNAVHPGTLGDYVYIGRASFIAGARPDIEAGIASGALGSPNTPDPYRAGWGYLLLTNALPNIPAAATEGGQGTFTLYAFAVDGDGRYRELGARTITLDNNGATRPFGSIDTPDQGGTITEVVTANFGWGMTQAGKCVDTTRTSSYRVFINGVPRTLTPVTNWVAGLARPDLAAAYPGLCNTNNALAAYYLNTSILGLTNGLHTIGWDIYDDNGTPADTSDDNVAGVGSRFFTVQLGSADAAAAADAAVAKPARLGDVSTLARPTEARAVQLTAGRRLAIDVGEVTHGYLRVGEELRDLPVGSTLDAGTGRFYWDPPVPYFGTYTLVFVGPEARVDLAVTLTAPGVVEDPVVTITTPRAGANPNPIITVTGTANDPSATTGTGVETVHVWARRMDQPTPTEPVFLGVAEQRGTSYRLTTPALAAGTYRLEVYARISRLDAWAPAATVVIAVR